MNFKFEEVSEELGMMDKWYEQTQNAPIRIGKGFKVFLSLISDKTLEEAKSPTTRIMEVSEVIKYNPSDKSVVVTTIKHPYFKVVPFSDVIFYLSENGISSFESEEEFAKATGLL